MIETTRGKLHLIDELAKQWYLSEATAQQRAIRYAQEGRAKLFHLVWFEDDSEDAPPIAIRPFKAGYVPGVECGSALRFRYKLGVLLTSAVIRDRIRPFDGALHRPELD